VPSVPAQSLQLFAPPPKPSAKHGAYDRPTGSRGTTTVGSQASRARRAAARGHIVKQANPLFLPGAQDFQRLFGRPPPRPPPPPSARALPKAPAPKV
jgi:hypothetical protein